MAQQTRTSGVVPNLPVNPAGYGAGSRTRRSAVVPKSSYDMGLADGVVVSSSPVITIISTPVLPSDPFILQIYSPNGFSFYHITCKDADDEPRYTVYDPRDLAFSHPFKVGSTFTGTGIISDPYIFTIYRTGGWPTNQSLDLRARAIGSTGREIDS